MALYWCTFQTLNCTAGMLRVAYSQGLTAFLLELYGFGPFFPAYPFAALLIWKQRKHSEVSWSGKLVCSPKWSGKCGACVGLARTVYIRPV
jgi:hypothetical protein